MRTAPAPAERREGAAAGACRGLLLERLFERLQLGGELLGVVFGRILDDAEDPVERRAGRLVRSLAGRLAVRAVETIERHGRLLGRARTGAGDGLRVAGDALHDLPGGGLIELAPGHHRRL